MAPAVVSPPGYLPAEEYLSTSYTGGLLIGAMFAFVFTGVLCHMAWVYYERFKHDRLIFKAIVAFLLVMNLIHSAFVFTYEYQNLIIGFGDISTLTDLKWSLTSSFSITAFVALTVQSFYSYRIFALLNRNWILPIAIVILSLAGVGFGIAANVKAAQIYITFPHPQFINAVAWIFDSAFALPAFADLLIVSGMFIGFWRTRKLDLPSASFQAIRRVLFLAMETNLVTTVLCIVAAATMSTNHRPIAFAITFNLPKAYALTLVTSLLARQSSNSGIKGDYQFDASASASIRRIVGDADQTMSTVSNSPARGVRIDCQVETVIEKDGILDLIQAGGPPRTEKVIPILLKASDKEDSVEDFQDSLDYV